MCLDQELAVQALAYLAMPAECADDVNGLLDVTASKGRGWTAGAGSYHMRHAHAAIAFANAVTTLSACLRLSLGSMAER
jgi:hypothetical protein